jgi:hypothetical protein
MRRRLSVAMALLGETSVLFLGDSPRQLNLTPLLLEVFITLLSPLLAEYS